MLINDNPKGQIVTFYSYKGGVGRSRALANTAYQLARNNKTVLCIDFDLEAPGLTSYFEKWIGRPKSEIKNQLGVLDIMYSYQDFVLTSEPFGEILDWKKVKTTIKIPKSDNQSVSLDFIGPGKQNTDYGDRVTKFDWDTFYKRCKGGSFIEHLRNQFIENYDFVLIDSRTGVSDIGGICTIQFPTILILAFSTSPQSVEGIETLIDDISHKHNLLRPESHIPIIPLPSRIDRKEEKQEYEKWFQRVSIGKIGNLLTYLGDKEEISNALNSIMVEYIPWYTLDLLRREKPYIS